MRDALRGLSVGFLVCAASCSLSEFGEESDPFDPGTSDPMWLEDDVSCSTNDDCRSADEYCAQGVCQPKLCQDGVFDSVPPLGEVVSIYADVELLEVHATEIDRAFGWFAQGTAVYSVESGAQQAVDSTGSLPGVDLGMTPVALAAGDVDGDGVDELVALSADGKLAVCDPGSECTTMQLSGATPFRDLATADVDGDGLAESIALHGPESESALALVRQQAQTDLGAGGELYALAAGDTDGDGSSELLVLDRAGWLDDELRVYSVSADRASVEATEDVTQSALDVTAGNFSSGETARIGVLDESGTVHVYRRDGSNLSEESTSYVSSSTDRIAVGDTDADSVGAHLVAGPESITAQAVPTIVATFPPHSATYSDGTPMSVVGSTDIVTESASDTVSLSASVTVGVEAGFLDIFKVGVSTHLSRRLGLTTGRSMTRVAGSRLTVRPDKSLHGEQYAAVMMSSGCYHSYTYEMEDKNTVLGADGMRFVVVVPVGSVDTGWSTKRFNAMAKATGLYEPIALGTRIGVPSSYPTSPETLAGEPVAAEDMLFTDRRAIAVSDAAHVGFSLSATESVTNEAAATIGLSVSSHIKVGGFSFGGSLGTSWRSAYSINVGDNVMFRGSVPPLSDNPDTPEDEYASNYYAFEPYVYRHAYTDAEGNDAGYFVLGFSVGQ